MKSQDKPLSDVAEKKKNEGKGVNRRQFLSSATAAGVAAASVTAPNKAITQ